MEEGVPGDLVELLVLEVGECDGRHGEGVEGTQVGLGLCDGLLGDEGVAEGQHRVGWGGGVGAGRGDDAETPGVAVLVPC